MEKKIYKQKQFLSYLLFYFQAFVAGTTFLVLLLQLY